MSHQKPVLSVRIDQRIMDRLLALEERTGVGRADIVERCLTVGMEDEERFVEWLESPIHGPLAQLLTHPDVLRVLLPIVNPRGSGVVDSVQQKVRNGIQAKKKARGLRAKPA